MSKKDPAKIRKALDDEFISASFKKEAAHGTLNLFKASAAFREHCSTAAAKVRLAGASMLKETKKLWLNLFFILLILFILFLSSCSDSVSPPGNNGSPGSDSILFHLDSFVLSVSDTGYFSALDTATYIFNAGAIPDSFYVMFRVRFYIDTAQPASNIMRLIFYPDANSAGFAFFDLGYFLTHSNNNRLDTAFYLRPGVIIPGGAISLLRLRLEFSAWLPFTDFYFMRFENIYLIKKH